MIILHSSIWDSEEGNGLFLSPDHDYKEGLSNLENYV